MWFCRGGHWPSLDLRRVHRQRTRNVCPCETANKNHSQPIEPARTNFPQGNFQRGGSVSASYSGTLWRGAGEPKRFTCRFFAALSSRRRKSHRFPRRAAERQIKQRVHTMHPYRIPETWRDCRGGYQRPADFHQSSHNGRAMRAPTLFPQCFT